MSVVVLPVLYCLFMLVIIKYVIVGLLFIKDRL